MFITSFAKVLTWRDLTPGAIAPTRLPLSEGEQMALPVGGCY